MKYVNFYSGTAMVLIASLLGSLASATGQMAPPLIVGALLITVLVLGWAGGASDARHEVDRLTRLESGRQLLTQSHIKQRDQLEAALARLQHRIEEVTASNAGLRKVAERWADEVGNLRAQARDSQAAIELFTAAQAKNMIRITALESENAELCNPLRALLELQPLVEPVYIGKALMAHREARVVLDGGTGPVAAVHLVNIGLTGWVYTKETAEAYARGWNSGVRALRGALTEAVVGKLLPVVLGDSLAGSASTASTCGCHACLHIAGTAAAAGMVLCSSCGCKRCPHANDHRHACTGSNEPGQPGSAYPAHVKVLAPGEQS